MRKNCSLCREMVGHYIWTSSRNFPREKLMELKNLKGDKILTFLRYEGDIVCVSCYEKLMKNKNDRSE